MKKLKQLLINIILAVICLIVAACFLILPYVNLFIYADNVHRGITHVDSYEQIIE